MTIPPQKRSGQSWINQIFTAGQVTQGNMVRRSMETVEKYSSAQQLQTAVQEKGFHMALIGTQYVILCNQTGQINVIC